MPVPKKKTPKTPAGPTQFVVLKETTREGDIRRTFELIAEHVTGNDDRQVIKNGSVRADLSGHERAGTFVPVPVRSWRPQPRAIKTVEVDEWGEPGPASTSQE